MSLTGNRPCTDKLKIEVIYNFLDHYIAQEYYGYTSEERPKGKKYIKRFTGDYGKIRVMIGISAEEKRRIMTSSKKEKRAMQIDAFKRWRNPVPYWFRVGIEKVYPLIDEDIARWDIHERTECMGFILPFPSNCKMCPYITKPEILWMWRFEPLEFYKWRFHESRKLAKWACKGDKNHGVKGEKKLDDFLKEAIEEYGHWTDEQLTEYKMSHGHCILSKY